jgi:hypothetical protein
VEPVGHVDPGAVADVVEGAAGLLERRRAAEGERRLDEGDAVEGVEPEARIRILAAALAERRGEVARAEERRRGGGGAGAAGGRGEGALDGAPDRLAGRRRGRGGLAREGEGDEERRERRGQDRAAARAPRARDAMGPAPAGTSPAW